MKRLLFFSLAIVCIFSANFPCEKLKFFGNNIQNKAVLSPVIIVGQQGMMIPLSNELYKATINIKSVIKGSLGDWKKNILIAGEFSMRNDFTDLCHFSSSSEEDRIYFFEVISAKNGEYNSLFNPEVASSENLEVINKTICNQCAEPPKLYIKDQSITENTIQLDCMTDSKPPSKIKWIKFGDKYVNVIELRNGARLTISSANNITNEMFTCTGANVLGESTTSIIIKAKKTTQMEEVSRCMMNDKLLCNGHGQCYKDKIDGGKMFCRCDPGYQGSRCSNNPNKTNYFMRTSNVDKTYCNNNGEGYKNVITNVQFCICKEGFYGKECSEKIASQSNKKNTMQRNKNTDITVKDNSDLKKMIEESSSKMAIKYIIIGALIVLGGCVIIILVILIMWKCCINNSTKKQKAVKINDDEITHFGTNHLQTRNNSNKFNDRLILLPGNTEVPGNTKPQIQYSNNNNNEPKHDMYLFTGNGIYEGVNMPQSQDSSSLRHAL